MKHLHRSDDNVPPATSIIHAGPLIMDRPDGQAALKLYLEQNARDSVLVHEGGEEFEEVAREAQVEDVNVGAVRAKSDEEAAAEFAIARRTDELEFAIDAPGVTNVQGTPFRWLTLHDATRLSKIKALDGRIREKLRAGCLAIREGVRRVRIGSPRALKHDFATELVPDPARPMLETIPPSPNLWTQTELKPLAASQRRLSSLRATESTRGAPWCRHSTERPKSSLRSLAVAIRF